MKKTLFIAVILLSIINSFQIFGQDLGINDDSSYLTQYSAQYKAKTNYNLSYGYDKPLPKGVTPSDERLKEKVTPLVNSIDKVKQLQGVSYTLKYDPDAGTKIGFIAQDMYKVMPEFVFINPVDGYYGINYGEITALLVEALKDQQKIIEKMQAEIDLLKGKK